MLELGTVTWKRLPRSNNAPGERLLQENFIRAVKLGIGGLQVLRSRNSPGLGQTRFKLLLNNSEFEFQIQVHRWYQYHYLEKCVTIVLQPRKTVPCSDPKHFRLNQLDNQMAASNSACRVATITFSLLLNNCPIFVNLMMQVKYWLFGLIKNLETSPKKTVALLESNHGRRNFRHTTENTPHIGELL